ncbi:MAG: response regulator transcription factor [Gammaproteobacteria bacterium]|nr:response regulator transcription factor [Gammaproteobacteria bacterium]
MTSPATHSILLVDDDRRLTTMLAELLELEGFACISAPNGSRGLLLLEEHRPDLVVLDVMMPGQDGIETLVQLRKQSNVPVIMLTAMGEEKDRIRGLEAGADDYLAKPFAARELLLRIRAILKRAAADAHDTANSDSRKAGPIEVRLQSQQAWLGTTSLDLTSTELRILAALVEKSGAVVTREFLSRFAIGRELMPEDRTLDTHVSNLRRKIATTCTTDCEIHTVRGSGYRLAVTS